MPTLKTFLNIVFKRRFIIYGLIILIGSALRFNNIQTLHLDPDAGGYIMPALSFFTDTVFIHEESRSWPYPLFVLTILYLFKSVKALCIIQHLLGILTGIIFILFLEYSGKLSGIASVRKKIFGFAVCAFSLSAFMLNGNIMLLEHTLRPEGIISLFVMLYIISLYWFYSSRKSISFIIIIFLSVLGLVAFPRLLLGSVMVILMTSYYYFKNNAAGYAYKISIFTGVSSFAFLLIILPETMLINKFDVSAKAFPIRQVFYSNAHIILKSMNENNYPEKSPETLNQSVRFYFDEYINKKPDNLWKPILNYNPDDLQYGACNNEVLNYFYNDDSSPMLYINQLHKYYFDWMIHIALHYPVDVLKKILKQLSFVFFNYKISFVSDSSEIIYSLNSSYVPKTDATKHYLFNQLNYPVNNNYTFNFNLLPLHFLLLIIFKIIFPLTITYSIIHFFQLTPFIKTLSIFIISSILLVASTHTFDIPRYLHSLIIIFLCLFSVLCSNAHLGKKSL
jgi:hypothetical protein